MKDKQRTSMTYTVITPWQLGRQDTTLRWSHRDYWTDRTQHYGDHTVTIGQTGHNSTVITPWLLDRQDKTLRWSHRDYWTDRTLQHNFKVDNFAYPANNVTNIKMSLGGINVPTPCLQHERKIFLLKYGNNIYGGGRSRGTDLEIFPLLYEQGKYCLEITFRFRTKGIVGHIVM